MTTFTYTKPTVGGSEDTWGDTLNANWDAVAAFIGPLDSTELAVLDGITASTAELNLLDGVTVTLADITATAAEINYLSGVTSAIQDQIDNIPAPPELTQVQVEDDTSTVFGQVSGQRLGQAIAALGSIPNTAGAIGTYVLGTTVNSDTARPQYVLGSTYAGSGLYPAGLASSQADNNLGNIRWDSTIDIAMKDNNVAALSGTWRAMGQTPNGAYDEMPVTLFVRIS